MIELPEIFWTLCNWVALSSQMPIKQPADREHYAARIVSVGLVDLCLQHRPPKMAAQIQIIAGV
jgi:hypothetical protein